jgi:hypothetical protein
MAIRAFTYPLKGNNDVASLRTKELALEAFLNSLNLSTDPDDPSHDHDSAYAAIAHVHPADAHSHDQYLVASEGAESPIAPDIGDVWIYNRFGTVEDISVWTTDGWVSVMGGGGGSGGGGPHSRHPDTITIYEATSNTDKWVMGWNPEFESLDFTYVG